MKYLSFVIIVGLISCSRANNSEAVKKSETPKVLQTETSEVSSLLSRERGDLVDELYAGAVDENKDLQNFEKLLDQNADRKNELIKELQFYENKNNRFYDLANQMVASITDSILKGRMVILLAKSQAFYKFKVNETESLQKAIERKAVSISEYHTALKIISTLAIMEKYQNDNIPAKAKYKTFGKQQDSTLWIVNKLISKINKP